MIVTRFENGIIVHSDGKSVWVNNPIHCVGRFSEIGFEIEPEKYVSGYDPVREPTNNSHWKSDVSRVPENVEG